MEIPCIEKRLPVYNVKETLNIVIDFIFMYVHVKNIEFLLGILAFQFLFESFDI